MHNFFLRVAAHRWKAITQGWMCHEVLRILCVLYVQVLRCTVGVYSEEPNWQTGEDHTEYMCICKLLLAMNCAI